MKSISFSLSFARVRSSMNSSNLKSNDLNASRRLGSPQRMRGRMRLLSLVMVATLAATATNAQDKPYIAVGEAKTKQMNLAIAPIKTQGVSATLADDLLSRIKGHLEFTHLFSWTKFGADVEPDTAGIAPGTFKYADWSKTGAEILVKSQLFEAAGILSYELYAYDTFAGKSILAKRYAGPRSELKQISAQAANDIVQQLTGQASIFDLKILMSCEVGKSLKKVKELFMMDYDGKNAQQITRHNSIAFAPAWNPDGTTIAYSLYAPKRGGGKNINLYEMDIRSKQVRLLSNAVGMNSGASYSPDGAKIVFTSSQKGSPELYLMDRGSLNVTQMTKTLGESVDPAFSPDGKEIAFTSTKSGKSPMIFRMPASPMAESRRVTFAGEYNATPDWSPDGKKIVFAGDLGGRFDLFTMVLEGQKIDRLTKNQGNNENPAFSPDGNYIVYNSNRAGSENIYVTNLDGSFHNRLTFGLGNCTTPRWSPKKVQ